MNCMYGALNYINIFSVKRADLVEGATHLAYHRVVSSYSVT
uniref:Uncharacterized protein n=1 Tax=Anguilla anguilla TaxID=7936 RepID=A0A0E9VWF6_ANGAN